MKTIHERKKEATATLVARIVRLRENGREWADIAQRCGLSRQAAQKHYSKHYDARCAKAALK